MLKTEAIPKYPNEAVIFLIEYLLDRRNEFFGSSGQLFEFKARDLRRLVELLRLAAIKSEFDIDDIVEKVDRIPPSKDVFYDVIKNVYHAIQLQKLGEEFDKSQNKVSFQWSGDELGEIASLIAEIRNKVRLSGLDQDHKRRLLAKIAEIEQELYKPNGKLRRVLDALDALGIGFGKFGKDVKPLTDRIAEITGTASRRAEGEALPPPDEVKRLPPPDRAGGEDFE